MLDKICYFSHTNNRKQKEYIVKKINLLLCFALLLFFSVKISGCNVSIESAVLKSGTLETTVVKNSKVDTSNAIIIVTYSDNTVKEVGAKNLKFSEIDTSKVTDNAKLTITYEDYSFDVKIRVRATADDVNDISAFTSTSQNLYLERSTAPAVGTTGFFNHEFDPEIDDVEYKDKYVGNDFRYVGTNNPFVLDLDVAGYNANDEEQDELVGVSTIVKIEMQYGEEFVELTEETTPKKSDIVLIQSTDAVFKFLPNAENKIFKITVEPKNKTLGLQTILKVELIVKVIDGYNVHNAKELSVYDNSGRDYDQNGIDDWNDIKIEAGTKNIAPNTIILQNDIEITNNDVPSTIFWSNSNILFNDEKPNEGMLSTYFDNAKNMTNLTLEGSFVDRDFTGVYHHDFSDGETLSMVGNYYTISCANLSRSVVETTGQKYGIRTSTSQPADVSYMTTHSTLFCNMYRNDSNMSKKTNVIWKNIGFTGNGSVSADPKYSGSIILFKSYRVNADIYNCTSNNFGINYLFAFGEDNNNFDGEYHIDYCKGYNSYQSLVFANGAEHLLISNSEFKSACGPAIITVLNGYDDYIDSNPSTTYHASDVDIVNSTIESIISGAEPWFATYGATDAVMQFKGAEAFFDGSAGLPQLSKSLIYDTINGNVTRLNMQILMMNDGDIATMFSSAGMLDGYTRFFDSMKDYNDFYLNDDIENFGLDMDNQIQQEYVLGQGGQNYIQTSEGDYFPPTSDPSLLMSLKSSYNFAGMFQSGDLALKQESADYWQTSFVDVEFINVYMPNGMGAVLEIYDRKTA